MIENHRTISLPSMVPEVLGKLIFNDVYEIVKPSPDNMDLETQVLCDTGTAFP